VAQPGGLTFGFALHLVYTAKACTRTDVKDRSHYVRMRPTMRVCAVELSNENNDVYTTPGSARLCASVRGVNGIVATSYPRVV